VMLKNFAGPEAIGFYQANRTNWSEKCQFPAAFNRGAIHGRPMTA